MAKGGGERYTNKQREREMVWKAQLSRAPRPVVLCKVGSSQSPTPITGPKHL